ncbi:MAG: hypothetical protein KF745_07840 [Phycisphaeraceae bacterium]|nr:hypothetical protein [Phycisphaeraceae bacterium]
MTTSRTAVLMAAGAWVLVLAGAGLPMREAEAQTTRRGNAAAEERAKAAEAKAAEKARLDAAVSKGVDLIVGMQEGDGNGEWPYEGVYRVGGKIPVGYRVGGTGIAALAVVQSPGYAVEGADGPRHAAVRRGVEFISKGLEHPLMSYEDYDAGYDVRGWGYTYSLLLCLRLKEMGQVPAGLEEAVEKIIAFDLAAIPATEIPQAGGWNYARPAGRDKVAPPSPFMTAPTLQALFEAKRLGYAVDEGVVNRGLDSLERARGPAGAISYTTPPEGKQARDPVPGAVGRMLATETTLALAGRGSVSNIRGAVDAFIVHWEWLNKRRAQQGTHVPPYMIAPYYFYYAHYYAAQAIEMLPSAERAEYRRRVNDLLFSVQLEDGSWNDRVFPRTANFGTSMAVMALRMPDLKSPAPWRAGAPAEGEEKKGEGDGG